MNTCIPFSEYNPYHHKIEARYSSLADCMSSNGLDGGDSSSSALPPECCADPGCQCLDGHVIIKEPSESSFYNSCVNPRDLCLSGEFWDWYAEFTFDPPPPPAAELKNNPPFDCLNFIYSEYTDGSCYSDGACSKRCPTVVVPPCWPNCPGGDSSSSSESGSSSSSSTLCDTVCVAVGEVQNPLTCECNCVCPEGTLNLGVIFDPNNTTQLICSCLVSSSSTSCPFIECGGESIASDCGLYDETCYMDCDLCECVCGSSSSESSSSSHPNYVCVVLKSSSSSSFHPNYLCVELKSWLVDSSSSSSTVNLGVCAPDFVTGKVVLAPYKSPNVGIYDLATNSIVSGPAHGQTQDASFTEVVKLSNGKVLFVPMGSLNIGIYDPGSNSYSSGPNLVTVTSSSGNFISGVELDNGKVLLVPHVGRPFGLYDIQSDSFSDGPSHAGGEGAFYGAVKLENGNVVVVPHYGAYVGLYDAVANTFAMGPFVGSSRVFAGGVLLPNGKVLFVPHTYAKIGLYDPIANTYSDGPDLSGLQSGGKGFASCSVLPDGRVMLVPFGSPVVGLYDPVSNTYTNGPSIPEPEGYIGLGYTPSHRASVVLPNGDVVFVPYGDSFFNIYRSATADVCDSFSVSSEDYWGGVFLG